MLVTVDIRPHPQDERNGKEAQRRVNKDIAKRLRPAKCRAHTPPVGNSIVGMAGFAELGHDEDEYSGEEYSGEEYGGEEYGIDSDSGGAQMQYMYAFLHVFSLLALPWHLFRIPVI